MYKKHVDNIEKIFIRGPKFFLARAPKFLKPALGFGQA